MGDGRAGAPLVLSADGSAPGVGRRARQVGGYTVDAVCPLVTKVHHEVKTRTGKGYQIVYVGHAGHEEAEGTIAVAPDSVHRVEHPDDVDALPDLGHNVAILPQTTLSHRDSAGVVDAALVLTIDPTYFRLTGGIERWLYRLVRKHGGRQANGWQFDFPYLYRKSGSLAQPRDFARDLRRLVVKQPLPGYELSIARWPGEPEMLFFRPVPQTARG